MNNKWIERMLVVAVVITSLVVLYSVVQSHAIHNEWVESRTIETIRVAPNETMWQIAEEYKPSWMDTREYIYEVKELNNLSDTYLYVGDELQVYIDVGNHYTMNGYYHDGTIITDDGNEWNYNTAELDNGSVVVTLADNHTNNIFDDIIIDITKE